MNFIDFINKSTIRKEPTNGIHGQIVTNYYSLENVKFKELIKSADVESLWVSFDDKENRLDISFNLLYKKYHLAEIDLELHSPFQFEFTTNANETMDMQGAITLLNDNFNAVFSVEVITNNIVIQANSEHLDCLLTVDFEKINIDIDFLNKTSFIDLLDKRTKSNKLFHTTCKEISDEQLTTIASADYGYDDKTFNELKSIRDNEVLPKEISFEMSEVLFLTYCSKPETQTEHQEIIFVCSIILSLEENDFTLLENIDNFLATLFLSINALEINLAKQARSFFLNLLTKKKEFNEIHLISYLVLAYDLLLKDQQAFKGTFNFLKEIKILEQPYFDHQSSTTARRAKEVTLIMLKNGDLIRDETLKNEANTLFSSMIRICEESYDTNAINALFERTFTKEQQEKYLTILPTINNLYHLERCKLFIEKGLSSQQVKLITASLIHAELFVRGSDSETELKRNVFFDAWVELCKKKDDEKIAL